MRKKIQLIRSAEDNGRQLIGKTCEVKGWIRTVRQQKTFTFMELNDGSCLGNLQVIIDSTVPNYESFIELLTTGAAVAVKGEIVESPGKNQSVELKAQTVEVIGSCDAEDYPLQKKRHSFEFLRTIAHLRPRTNTIGAITRVRDALAFATHKFFHEEGFFYVNTPIITASDCEGAGELFKVTTLDMENVPKSEGKVDYKEDFFDRPSFLTVSGQLNAEIYALAMGDVYTFGPTFRAENSNTSRHLAEFWMIEPEMAFADIHDDMDCAEAYLKSIFTYIRTHCDEDLNFFDRWVSKGTLERIDQVINQPFERLTYTEAVAILEKSGKNFEFPVEWGAELQSEHERYLAEEHLKRPLIIRDYPKGVKAFYMRLNDDEKTVAAMDVVVPRIGEIIGGSQREERSDVLKRRLKAQDLDEKDYWWYLDLRRFGSVPHAGFGLGFERLVQFATGMDNIRDVIPFPRTPGHADF